MTSPELVYIRDTSSGTVHARFKEQGSVILASFEGDNADQSGDFVVLTSEQVSNIDSESLCKRCFPVIEGGAP